MYIYTYIPKNINTFCAISIMLLIFMFSKLASIVPNGDMKVSKVGKLVISNLKFNDI